MPGRRLLTKLGRGVLTVRLIVTLTFVALSLSGGPIDALVGDQASPEIIEHYHQKFGLDRPFWQQYLSCIAGIAQGDFGLSLSDQRPAVELIAGALNYPSASGRSAIS